MKKWLVATALIATTISGVTQAKEWKTVRFGIEVGWHYSITAST